MLGRERRGRDAEEDGVFGFRRAALARYAACWPPQPGVESRRSDRRRPGAVATEVLETRVALRDSLRRLSRRLRPDDSSEAGGGGGRGQRQPDESTIALGSSASTHEPAAASRPPGAHATGAATRATALPSRGPEPLPAAEPTAPRAAPAGPPAHPVDPLAVTRVVPAAGEKPRVVGVLVAVEGELEGTVAPIVSGTNRLGRHPECEISLPSEWISRHHAKIECGEGAFRIEASSDKPTVVNSERIDGSELRDGDYVTLGKTTLRFRSI